MRKTKIVCTLGPSTDRDGVLEALVLGGMDIARFNFSHGDHEEHRRRLEALRAYGKAHDCPVAAMLDTGGPEIRLGEFGHTREELKTGQQFVLTSERVLGDSGICSVSYPNLWKEVEEGGHIMLDDGRISLRITKVREKEIVCTVENGGVIKSRKGVNVPGVHLTMPYLSKKDREDILFGVEQGFDLIAASFTRCAEDILEMRALLGEKQETVRIIAKIENREGVDNIEEILKVADGIMVARGDMGVEIDYTVLPALQKQLIRRAVEAGKLAITATQMLDSMIGNPRPTRAEITDVANAIYDGATAVMLSGETAVGMYSVEALHVMSAIVEATENGVEYSQLSGHIRMRDSDMGINGATAYAAAAIADRLGAKAIITVSQSGETVRLISGCRPTTPVVACVQSEEIRRRANFYRGTIPVVMGPSASTDELIENGIKAALERGLVEKGDTVVVTAGVPIGIPGTTNMIKVHVAGEKGF